MARPDFTKVWAGSRPSIPEISDPSYALGFADYLGAQPPTTDDHDYIMNLQDQRAKWLAEVIDSPRIDIASASTVNLASLAPDTRNIRITGTTTIIGFTIEAGQNYFVTFSGALTLTNSGSLVTNSGDSRVTAAGDTCIIRATAENTVEVLCYALRAATQAEVDAGALDDVAVTPMKLQFGFNALFGIAGFIAFPSWLGGFIIQWGQVSDFAWIANTFRTATYPITFPTQIFQSVATLSNSDGTMSRVCTSQPSTSQIQLKIDYSGSGTVRYIALGK